MNPIARLINFIRGPQIVSPLSDEQSHRVIFSPRPSIPPQGRYFKADPKTGKEIPQTPRSSPMAQAVASLEPQSSPRPSPTLLPGAPENPYMDLIKRYFPPEEHANASNVMFRESSFNPQAINRNTNASADYGLFQINDAAHGEELKRLGIALEQLKNPETNVKFARRLFDRSKWNPWVAAGPLGLK